MVTHYLDLAGLSFIQRHNWRLRLAHRGTHYDSLDEALAVIPPQCRISLDLKDDGPTTSGPLVDHVLHAVSEPSRFVACSNHWLSLGRLSTAGFETWASVGSRSALARVGEALKLASGITVRHTYLSADSVRTAHESGRIVAAWTVNDVARAEQLLGWGVDAITTDNPAVLTKVASARDESAGG